MSLPVPGRFGDLGGVGVLAQGDGAGAQLLLGMPEDFMYGFHVFHCPWSTQTRTEVQSDCL